MSDNKNLLSIIGYSGLGDRLCDIIGSYIIAKYLGYKLNIIFNPVIGLKHAWGNTHIYDIRLFDFNDENIKIFNNQNDINLNYNYYIRINHHAISSSVYSIYKFIKNFKDITIGEIIDNYYNYVNEIIKPSKLIQDNIPENLNNCYGIHLRKSDTIKPNDNNHGATLEQYNIMINLLFNDICNIILNENEPSFLLVSEDYEWKNYYKNELVKFANNNNKKINIINLNYDYSNIYDNYNDVLDLFCLSKCKKIFQCCKHSTFSVCAAIIGNVEIINYSHIFESYKTYLIHLYNPLIKINNNKISNIDNINYILSIHEPHIISNLI